MTNALLNTMLTSLHVNSGKNLASCIVTNYFPMHTRKKIVKAVLFPVLDYCDVIYRNAAALHTHTNHHCVLNEKVGWSSLRVCRETDWLLFIYKALTGHIPILEKSAFSYRAPASWNLLQENSLVSHELAGVT